MGSTNSKATAGGAVVGVVVGATVSGAGAAVVLGAIVAKATNVVANSVSRAFFSGGRDQARTTAKSAAVGAVVGAVSSCVIGPIGGTVVASVLAVSCADEANPPEMTEREKLEADIQDNRYKHACAKAAVCTVAGMLLRPYMGVTVNNVIELNKWPTQAVVPSVIGFIYEALFDMPLSLDTKTLWASQMFAGMCFNIIPYVVVEAATWGFGWALFHAVVQSMGPHFLMFFVNSVSHPISEYTAKKRHKETLAAIDAASENNTTAEGFKADVDAATRRALR